MVVPPALPALTQLELLLQLSSRNQASTQTAQTGMSTPAFKDLLASTPQSAQQGALIAPSVRPSVYIPMLPDSASSSGQAKTTNKRSNKPRTNNTGARSQAPSVSSKG